MNANEKTIISSGMLNVNELIQIKQWTNKSFSGIVFDSNRDDWSDKTSVFDRIIFNRSHLLFVIEDEEGNRFGGYVDAVIDNYQLIENEYLVGESVTDPKAFVFTLKSNGRMNGMMKFNVKYDSTDWAF